MADINPPRLAHRRRWPWLIGGGATLLIVLVVDFGPALPPSTPPSAEQAQIVQQTAKALFQQMSSNASDGTVWLGTDVLRGGSALVSNVSPGLRARAGIEGDEVALLVSRHLAGPLWLNVQARVPPSTTGLPAVRLTVGDLPLGETVSRWVLESGSAYLRWRGMDLPPLDGIVRNLHIRPNGVQLSFHFPNGRSAIGAATSMLRPTADPALTTAIYCRLSAADQRAPSADFAVAVRRAFAAAPERAETTAYNQAAFVALAMWADAPRVGVLAGDARERVHRCRSAAEWQLLHGRNDLARHWSISAALAATSNADITNAMGQWKELADSRPTGSGFSFIDLAADRAGMKIGRASMASASAVATASSMREATQESLLPFNALALSEGLSEQQFIERYRTIRSREYEAAIARIDQILATRNIE